MRKTWLFVVVMLVASGAWTPAGAQQSGDKWNVFVAPYVLGAGMSGTTTLRGDEVNVDLSAGDIFSNLQFGAMGMAVARKGNWGFGTDLIWMALGTTVREVNVDFNQGAFAFYGLRALGPSADVTFGMRVNTLQGKLAFKRLGVNRDQDKTWVNPIVGLSLHSPAGRRVTARLYSEIGGFGAGSDFTWQLFPTVGIGMGKSASLELGYRWLDIKYASGDGSEKFGWDVLTQGPVAGVGFKF